MRNIAQILEFVNTQAEFHTKKADSYAARALRTAPEHVIAQCKSRSDAHRRLARDFDAIAESLADAQITRRSPVQGNLTLTPEDIDGLPAELIDELSISDADKADFNLLTIIEEAGGVLSLDRILIGMYKRTGEIGKRTAVNARIYRMVQRGTLFMVAGKKGVYSTRELTPEEVDAIS